MTQQQKKGPLGPDADQGKDGAGLKRQAPASDTLLKEIDTAVKEDTKREQFEKRKKRILERCGCL